MKSMKILMGKKTKKYPSLVYRITRKSLQRIHWWKAGDRSTD